MKTNEISAFAAFAIIFYGGFHPLPSGAAGGRPTGERACPSPGG